MFGRYILIIRSFFRRALIEFTCGDGDGKTSRTQTLGKGLAHGHGTMLPTGASDGDGDIMLVLLRIPLDRDRDGPFIGIEEFLGPIAGKHIIADRLVLARHGTQLRHPERIRQEANVGHEIGVDWNAVFESEAEDVHGNGGRSDPSMASYSFVDN